MKRWDIQEGNRQRGTEDRPPLPFPGSAGDERHGQPKLFFKHFGRNQRDARLVPHDDQALAARYAGNIRMMERIPDALSGAMGNRMFVAAFPTEEEMNAFYADAVREREE